MLDIIHNSSGNSICLEDTPAEGEFEVNPTELVGIKFNADEQCKAQYGPNADFCPFSFSIQVSYSLHICQLNTCLDDSENVIMYPFFC